MIFVMSADYNMYRQLAILMLLKPAVKNPVYPTPPRKKKVTAGKIIHILQLLL